MTNIDLHIKYEPLAALTTRYALIEGGRGSGKSFAIATILLAKTEQYIGKTILFTRYTLTNAETSIMPEFMDKIERGNLSARFHKSGNNITNLATGTTILFRGIKTSTGINTAALKSIPNLALWVNDESEEFTDEATFDTIDLSIRDNDVHCEVWLVLNPPDKHHFIYRKFHKGPGVPDGTNGIYGDVTYIHTTYKDNPHLPQDYRDKADAMALTNPDKYRNIWLGLYKEQKGGKVYSKWERITPEEYPEGLPQWYANDWGFSQDPDALVRMCYDPVHAIIYVKLLRYATGMLARDVAKAIIADGASLVRGTEQVFSREKGCMEDRTLYYTPEYCTVYCDPARPESINELRAIYGIDARPAVNRDKAGRVAWLSGFRVRYVGAEIEAEESEYVYRQDPHDKTRYTDMPEDGNDHAMDAINYGAVSHLRPQGVSGEN